MCFIFLLYSETVLASQCLNHRIWLTIWIQILTKEQTTTFFFILLSVTREKERERESMWWILFILAYDWVNMSFCVGVFCAWILKLYFAFAVKNIFKISHQTRSTAKCRFLHTWVTHERFLPSMQFKAQHKWALLIEQPLEKLKHFSRKAVDHCTQSGLRGQITDDLEYQFENLKSEL